MTVEEIDKFYKLVKHKKIFAWPKEHGYIIPFDLEGRHGEIYLYSEAYTCNNEFKGHHRQSLFDLNISYKFWETGQSIDYINVEIEIEKSKNKCECDMNRGCTCEYGQAELHKERALQRKKDEVRKHYL